MITTLSFVTFLVLSGAPPDRLIIFHAGSLSAPLEAIEKEFTTIEPAVEVRRESAGSVESARKITDLHREADVLAVADYKVIEGVLFPAYASWSVIFARNHMVLAYTEKSKYAEEVTASNWYDILQRKGVEYGRADPDKDPCGYRTLMVWQLAERFYGVPGLNDRLVKGCPVKNIRPKEVDMVALQEAGDLDYHFQYRSVAEQHKMKYLRLPPQIDLGSYQFKDLYASARVQLHGKKPGETITMTGEPILYAVTIPKNAPHPALAQKFLALLLGPTGQAIMGRMGQEPVVPPLAVNYTDLPEGLRTMAVPRESREIRRTGKSVAPPLSKGKAVLDIYKDGVLVKRLTHEDAKALPQKKDGRGDLAPAWILQTLIESLNIPLQSVKKIVITGGKDETLEVTRDNLTDSSLSYLLGYNRKKLIKLMVVPEGRAWKGEAGHGPGAIRQVTKVEVFPSE